MNEIVRYGLEELPEQKDRERGNDTGKDQRCLGVEEPKVKECDEERYGQDLMRNEKADQYQRKKRVAQWELELGERICDRRGDQDLQCQCDETHHRAIIHEGQDRRARQRLGIVLDTMKLIGDERQPALKHFLRRFHGQAHHPKEGEQDEGACNQQEYVTNQRYRKRRPDHQ